ncbi:acyl carrier protein [Anaerococcus hydrogenalis]|uniref:Acyl carrier protein n=3 Tax=Anaerococcus hydrogenalis TaxID=33029 RepID=F0H277_9FIRM|nr:phosphopantetheine-binding protein [Anaerococcus hydrogenalis]EEB36957.1 putative acyl carrier protein [Anaerococcus hydrogenalis DSM 7454]EGC83385.1 putative acyl carrier protein [Anaerococcus hydrogenalis ACS-025-V-Sch4]MBS5989473.1 acyl carrier protein [Anaerococcus hydrogenalis]MDK7694314.1 phosphopantetheine-binding protein [Anaerococcus hydrogenalis]MDK7696092.1 phosphopantetheine-binding protein [Anaerococcus hydrogenalis]
MIRDELLELVRENLDIDVDEVDFDKAISDYDIDSIDMLDFIMAIEDKYDIEFSDDELDEIEKFSDVVSLIESKN